MTAWLWQWAGERADEGAVPAGPHLHAAGKLLAYSFIAAAVLVAATVHFLGAAPPPRTFLYFRF